MGMASRDQGDRPIRAAKTLLPASAACAQLHRGCTVSANCGQASRPRRGWACVKTGGKRSGESRSLSEASREGRWRKGGWRPAHRFALGEGRRWASRCPRGGNATDAVRPRDKGERDPRTSYGLFWRGTDPERLSSSSGRHRGLAPALTLPAAPVSRPGTSAIGRMM